MAQITGAAVRGNLGGLRGPPGRVRADLAASLHNLPVLLGDLDRPEDALAAIQEATDTYREPAESRPDAFRPDLARSLHNLSNRLADLSDR